jgi:ABC-type transport system substrate-binding protein
VFVNKSYTASGVVSSVRFANNPTYWGGAANLSTIEVVAYYDAVAITADLLSGALQRTYNVVLDHDFQGVFTHSTAALRFTAQLGSLFQTRTVQCYSEVPGLSDPRVRWALIHSMDKTQLIQQVLFDEDQRQHPVHTRHAVQAGGGGVPTAPA